MALNYTIKQTVTTTAIASDCARFFHGTLVLHCHSLGQGIDFGKCGGSFWVTDDLENARYYASLAEQQLMFGLAGQGQVLVPGQAIFAFDFPKVTLDNFMGQQPEPWLLVFSQGYRFSPACCSYLNTQMTNIEITFEE
jgi:hypothetical protein